LAAACLCGGPALAGDTFTFEMPDLRLRIVVPDVPQMRMAVHPNNAMQPHARFMGSDDGTGHVVSVLLPTADPGMTPRDCAQWVSRSVARRFGLDPKYVVTLQADESTFVMLFPYRVDRVIQFKAFVLSGYKGTHCVEVHVSRTMAPAAERALAEDLAKWFRGFRGAKIETY
jgi:hypothetical protein